MQDKAPSINEITGSILSTKPSSEAYRDNWDRIFRKKEEPKKTIILLNQIKCNICEDIITSKHVHDFVTCKCGHCSADGGIAYLRRIGEDYTELSMSADEDDIGKIREYFTWGTYGPKGDQPKRYILLKNMDTDHIEAILSTQWHIYGTITEKIMNLELEYRKECKDE